MAIGIFFLLYSPLELRQMSSMFLLIDECIEKLKFSLNLSSKMNLFRSTFSNTFIPCSRSSTALEDHIQVDHHLICKLDLVCFPTKPLEFTLLVPEYINWSTLISHDPAYNSLTAPDELYAGKLML